MRAVWTLISAITLFGCGDNSYTYMDLREQIYLVPRKSFWDGCEQDPRGYQACRHWRIGSVYRGVNEWFKYFDKESQPQVVVVDSILDIPWYAKNKPIYLSVDKNFCKKALGFDCEACYYYSWHHRKEIKIVFVSANTIDLFMDHEFGHALGRNDNDVPEGTISIMSYSNPGPVSLPDVAMVCQKHRECQLRREK